MEGTSPNDSDQSANRNHDDKFSFEEIARPQCRLPSSFSKVRQNETDTISIGHFTGSIFVTAQARTALKGLRPNFFGTSRKSKY
jgi:hypothetical protein